MWYCQFSSKIRNICNFSKKKLLKICHFSPNFAILDPRFLPYADGICDIDPNIFHTDVPYSLKLLQVRMIFWVLFWKKLEIFPKMGSLITNLLRHEWFKNEGRSQRPSPEIRPSLRFWISSASFGSNSFSSALKQLCVQMRSMSPTSMTPEKKMEFFFYFRNFQINDMPTKSYWTKSLPD